MTPEEIADIEMRARARFEAEKAFGGSQSFQQEPQPELSGFDRNVLALHNSDFMDFARPVAEGVTKGLATPYELGAMALNLGSWPARKAIELTTGWKPPSVPSSYGLIEAILNPNPEMSSDSLAGTLGNIGGTVGEFTVGGGAVAKALGAAGKAATNFPRLAEVLKVMGKYGNRELAFDAGLGATVGGLNEYSDGLGDIAGLTPLAWTAGRAGVRGGYRALSDIAESDFVANKLANWLAPENINPNLRSLILDSPEVSIAKYIKDENLNNPARKIRLIEEMAPSMNDSAIMPDVRALSEDINNTAIERTYDLLPGSSMDITEKGTRAINRLEEARSAASNIYDEAYRVARETVGDVEVTVTGDVKNTFKSALKEIQDFKKGGKLTKTADLDQLEIGLTDIIRGKNGPKDIDGLDNIHKQLVDIQAKLPPGQKRVVGLAMKKLAEIVPDEYKTAWEARRNFGEIFENKNTFLGKVLKRDEVTKSYAIDPDKMAKALEKATPKDFSSVAAAIGPTEAQDLFKQTFSERLRDISLKFATTAGEAESVKAMRTTLDKLLENETMYKKVFGAKEWDDVKNLLQDIRTSKELAEAAKSAKILPYNPIGSMSGDMQAMYGRLKIPGVPVAAGLRPKVLARQLLANKQDRNTRLLFNTLTKGTGVPAVQEAVMTDPLALAIAKSWEEGGDSGAFTTRTLVPATDFSE